MKPERIAELRKAEAKMTPGPWETIGNEEGHVIIMGSAISRTRSGRYEPQHEISYRHGLYLEDGRQFEEAVANAEGIALLRNHAKALLDIAESHERLLPKLENVVAWLRRLEQQAIQQAATTRFVSIADAARTDAENYRKTADELRAALAAAPKKGGE